MDALILLAGGYLFGNLSGGDGGSTQIQLSTLQRHLKIHEVDDYTEILDFLEQGDQMELLKLQLLGQRSINMVFKVQRKEKKETGRILETRAIKIVAHDDDKNQKGAVITEYTNILYFTEQVRIPYILSFPPHKEVDPVSNFVMDKIKHFPSSSILVMPMVEGTSWRKAFRDDPMDIDIHTAALDVIVGLAVMHKHFYLHRDIKPENIVHDQIQNRSVIIDLGSLQYFPGIISRDGRTPNYYRYTFLSGLSTIETPSMDWFSLGMSLISLFSKAGQDVTLSTLDPVSSSANTKIGYKLPNLEYYRNPLNPSFVYECQRLRTDELKDMFDDVTGTHIHILDVLLDNLSLCCQTVDFYTSSYDAVLPVNFVKNDTSARFWQGYCHYIDDKNKSNLGWPLLYIILAEDTPNIFAMNYDTITSWKTLESFRYGDLNLKKTVYEDGEAYLKLLNTRRDSYTKEFRPREATTNVEKSRVMINTFVDDFLSKLKSINFLSKDFLVEKVANFKAGLFETLKSSNVLNVTQLANSFTEYIVKQHIGTPMGAELAVMDEDDLKNYQFNDFLGDDTATETRYLETELRKVTQTFNSVDAHNEVSKKEQTRLGIIHLTLHNILNNEFKRKPLFDKAEGSDEPSKESSKEHRQDPLWYDFIEWIYNYAIENDVVKGFYFFEIIIRKLYLHVQLQRVRSDAYSFQDMSAETCNLQYDGNKLLQKTYCNYRKDLLDTLNPDKKIEPSKITKAREDLLHAENSLLRLILNCMASTARGIEPTAMDLLYKELIKNKDSLQPNKIVQIVKTLKKK